MLIKRDTQTTSHSTKVNRSLNDTQNTSRIENRNYRIKETKMNVECGFISQWICTKIAKVKGKSSQANQSSWNVFKTGGDTRCIHISIHKSSLTMNSESITFSILILMFVVIHVSVEFVIDLSLSFVGTLVYYARSLTVLFFHIPFLSFPSRKYVTASKILSPFFRVYRSKRVN